MNRPPDLRLLFPTNFSEACFQTGRAIAQLADDCRIDLTIVHVVPRGGATTEARRELESFLAEGDHFDRCQRLLFESSDAPSAVAAVAERAPFDLILSPSSDRFGLHSAFVPSFRGRLLRLTRVPVWTIGPAVAPARFRQRIRNVACLADFGTAGQSRLRLAAAFAQRFGARLHAIDVIPPITDGTILDSGDSDRPLSTAASLARMRELLGEEASAEFAAAVGDHGRALRRLLEACEADVVLIGDEQATRGIILRRFTRQLDRLPCPVVCLGRGSEASRQWSFERIGRAVVPPGRHEWVKAG